MRAWFAVVSVRLLLFILPFEKLLGLVPLRTTPSAEHRPDWIAAGRLSWAVHSVSAYVPMSTCLVQAMALQFLLNREHFGAELKIGVSRDASGEFCADAWVESRGKILIGSLPTLHDYRPMPMK